MFLYFVVESLRHTRSRKRYLLRMWLASLAIGMANLGVSYLFFDGGRSFGNILQSLTWVVFFICVADTVRDHFRKKELRRAAVTVLGAVLLLAVVFLVEKWYLNPSHVSDPLLLDLWPVFVCSPRRTEYSILFVLVGVVWFFQTSRRSRCILLAVLSVVSLFFWGSLDLAFSFAGAGQWGMVFAIPFLLLYDGSYGSGHKRFFYLYYPLHQYVLALVFSVLS